MIGIEVADNNVKMVKCNILQVCSKLVGNIYELACALNNYAWRLATVPTMAQHQNNVQYIECCLT